MLTEGGVVEGVVVEGVAPSVRTRVCCVLAHTAGGTRGWVTQVCRGEREGIILDCRCVGFKNVCIVANSIRSVKF